MATPVGKMLRIAADAGAVMAAAAAFTALGIAAVSAIVWVSDSRGIPGYAIAWLLAWTALGLTIGIPVYLLRRFIGRMRLYLAAAFAAGVLGAVCLFLGFSYRNSCSALGWHYDDRADLVFPLVVWSDDLNCSRIGRYQHFSGVWTYGEWSNDFVPSGDSKSMSAGRLRIEDAATNLIFDKLLHQRVSPRAERKIFISFHGNMLIQGKHDSAHAAPTYWVRDVEAARLIER